MAEGEGVANKVTDADFDEFVKSHDMAIIDCYADWCFPCRMLSPTIEKLAFEFKGKLFFGKLNVDDNPKTSGKYAISNIPTLLFFKKGEHVDTLIGAVPKQEIEQVIFRHLKE